MNHVNRRLARVAVASLLLPTSLFAQPHERLSLRVSFRFTTPLITNVLSSIPQTEQAIVDKLLPLLNTRFPLWDFQTATSNEYPILRLRETGQTPWNLEAELVMESRAKGEGKCSGLLFAPGEVDQLGLPGAANWPDLVERQCDRELLSPGNVEKLEAAFQDHIPLGQAVPLNDPPQPGAGNQLAVLPLAWSRFEPWATCEFHIHCFSPQLGEVVLQSVGIGAPYDFTPSQPQFKGLLVKHRMWINAGETTPVTNHLHELTNLVVRGFYLKGSPSYHLVASGIPMYSAHTPDSP